jgi:hypothetical protein
VSVQREMEREHSPIVNITPFSAGQIGLRRVRCVRRRSTSNTRLSARVGHSPESRFQLRWRYFSGKGIGEGFPSRWRLAAGAALQER